MPGASPQQADATLTTIEGYNCATREHIARTDLAGLWRKYPGLWEASGWQALKIKEAVKGSRMDDERSREKP